MKKFKGTQGKWKVSKSKFGQVGYIASENGHTIASIYAETNAPYRSYSNRDHEELLANTKLIASAPELLQKLQYMVDAWEDVRISGRKDIMEDFTDMAKETIKKATE